MKVVDIRNVFEKRRIQLFYVDDDFIYYAEEKLQGELSNLYILEYNRDTRRERLVTNYTLEDSSFVQHIFAFEETILLVLENGSSSIWVVELDRRSGILREDFTNVKLLMQIILSLQLHLMKKAKVSLRSIRL